MTSIAHLRKESTYFKVVSRILSEEIRNSNISPVTVTTVSLSRDDSVLKIYVSFLNNPKVSFENLKRTIPFIRKRLSQVVSGRKAPNIKLIFDDSLEVSRKIEKILADIKKNK